MSLNPGDLVKLNRSFSEVSRYWLYAGENECWDARGVLIPSSIAFERRDTGIVLMMKKLMPSKHAKHYVKLLTPGGIGWIFETYLEKIAGTPGEQKN